MTAPEIVYTYCFSVWPREDQRPGLFEIFRGKHRIELDFTVAQWEKFRDDIEASCLTFREVERRPTTAWEPVTI